MAQTATANDDPGHPRLFTPDTMNELFVWTGARRVRIDHVPNHLIAIAQR